MDGLGEKINYATVTWSDAPDNRRIAVAWMSNWQYANDVPTSQYRSPNSVPAIWASLPSAVRLISNLPRLPNCQTA